MTVDSPHLATISLDGIAARTQGRHHRHRRRRRLPDEQYSVRARLSPRRAAIEVEIGSWTSTESIAHLNHHTGRDAELTFISGGRFERTIAELTNIAVKPGPGSSAGRNRR